MTGERRDRDVHQEAPDANDEAKGKIALHFLNSVSYFPNSFSFKMLSNEYKISFKD